MSPPSGIIEHMFEADLSAKSPDELLAGIAEFARREKALAELQFELLGELVRRYFTGISVVVQGTPLPVSSSRGLMARFESSTREL